MSYNKNINHLNDNIMMENEMSKWNYFIAFDVEIRIMGILKYVKLL